jgi:hydrogenase maturation protease
MKTLVVGLGNPILGDDGVGWKVAEKVCEQLPADAIVDVNCLSLGGLSLMEHLIGYDRAILIDAFASDEDFGSIKVMSLTDMPNYSAFHISNAHDTSLQNAIDIGRELGAHLPEEIMVVGIATRRIYDFSEELSPPVAEVVSQVVKLVLDLLRQNAMTR